MKLFLTSTSNSTMSKLCENDGDIPKHSAITKPELIVKVYSNDLLSFKLSIKGRPWSDEIKILIGHKKKQKKKNKTQLSNIDRNE